MQPAVVGNSAGALQCSMCQYRGGACSVCQYRARHSGRKTRSVCKLRQIKYSARKWIESDRCFTRGFMEYGIATQPSLQVTDGRNADRVTERVALLPSVTRNRTKFHGDRGRNFPISALFEYFSIFRLLEHLVQISR